MGFLDILKDLFYFPIFNILMVLYWIVRDFGLSIVLLTIGVRAAMVPLTFKQLRSSRKMMELQPQIAALKAQYGDDKQGFAKAQMELMRSNNASMLGGCLPLLIQMPFLYGLFYALQGGLRGTVTDINNQIYPFLKFAHVTGIITSAAGVGTGGTHPLDPFLRWFSWLPGNPVLNLNLPDPTHVLPILAALFTFIQVRMSQVQRKPAVAPVAGDTKAVAQQQATQQAMGFMQYIMPLFTLWIGWQYAAGLALYWTVGTLFLICQQYIIGGWGGLFKGIPRLEQWAAQKNTERELRLAAKKALVTGPIVDAALPATGKSTGSLPALPSGRTRNGKNAGKSSDWIDQAKDETQGDSNGNGNSTNRPRPFPTLTKPKDAPTLKTEASAEGTNGVKNGAGAGAKSGSVRPNPPNPPPKPGAQQARRNPPRAGSLPKSKGRR